MKRLCLDCKLERHHAARGLCIYCYSRNRTAGTLDQYPPLAKAGNGIPMIEGLSYRQLDYWVRVGYLHPRNGRGSGDPRVWPDEEVAVAQRMARLVAAGIGPALAERIARGEVEIGPGVKVLVTS